jgi:hypothetical protein
MATSAAADYLAGAGQQVVSAGGDDRKVICHALAWLVHQRAGVSDEREAA